jgi:polyisoprenoid-binding protein YceI
MRPSLIPLAAALLFAAGPVAAQPSHWTVDHAKSKLGFSVAWSGEQFVATFRSWNADIAFDPNDLGHSRASVTIDLGSEASGFDENDQGLKGTQGFEVSKFPTARFEATKFSRGKDGNYVAEGTLNLHGMSKAVTLPFTLSINGNTAHMTGRAQVMRADFGLARGEFANNTPIAHAVTVNVDVTATKS